MGKQKLQVAIDQGEENLIIKGDLNGLVEKIKANIKGYMDKEGVETKTNNDGIRIIEMSIEIDQII